MHPFCSCRSCASSAPPTRRWLSTLQAIEKNLTEDSLVYCYNDISSPVDGLSGSEGSFTACSFWFIECLARSHQLEKARLVFDKMLGYANHVGLYSEQLGSSGEHLGNFPASLHAPRAHQCGHVPRSHSLRCLSTSLALIPIEPA